MSKLKLETVKPSVNFVEAEERVQSYWQDIHAFEKSVEERPEDKPYVFYDGPPFATGMPHYGHLLASTIKDVVPRYWTMKGYRVERVWGWDCHGVPIENMVEKQLGLEGGKKGIEAMGIDKFNAACRAEVLRLDTEWERIIGRLGRWVDFKNNYKTMDTTFMESVWWAFKSLHDKGQVYQGRKVILFCPRCSTPLSNFEIAMDNSYKDVEDNSITIKFKVKGEQNTFLLAWTTTPWTLIGNVGLAVNPTAEYVLVEEGSEQYYLAKSRLENLKGEYKVLKTLPGSDLAGVEYEPLYGYLNLADKKAHYVMTGDFVSLEEGTGIVHTAAMYGEDDYQLALKHELPLVDMLDDQGKFMDFVEPLKGVFYKKAEAWVLEDLTSRNLLYQHSKITHSYPFCYRCDSPLYYTAVPAWFINVQDLKPTLIESNESINWYPGHLKHGRFGKGLETAPDWNISRSRYWGTPMPVWEGEKTKTIRIIGSIEELKQWAVDPKKAEKLTDIHREYVDDIEVWVDEQKTEKGKRIREVFDCWVESGSMPYASIHYPFENKEKFEARHPAQFISEYIAQTRAWFYTLHVMSVGLFGKPTFQNALTTGTIMATDGTKMSKSKKNYTDPMELINKYGVDSLRLFFTSSPIMKTAENVNFSEKAIDEIRKKVFTIFWNVFAFYKLYGNDSEKYGYPKTIHHPMDRWLASRVNRLMQEVTAAMDSYDVVTASRKLMEHVDELSTWYLRQSRDRLRDNASNAESLQVFRTAILHWCLLAAPFAPFFTEMVYHNLPGMSKESIHLELLPEANADLIDDTLEANMTIVGRIVEAIHALRKEKAIKVRQPLASATISGVKPLPEELVAIVKDEVNIKALKWQNESAKEIGVELDTTMTPELEEEGKARELIRAIQDARKAAGTDIDEWVEVELPDWPAAFAGDIKSKVLAKKLTKGDALTIYRLS